MGDEMMRAAALTALIIGLAGALSPIRPSLAQEPATVAPLPPDRFDGQALKYFRRALKDFSSAIIERNGVPHAVSMRSKNKELKGEDRSGTLACYRVNGRNSYGAFSGFKDYAFFISDAGGDMTVLTNSGAGHSEVSDRCPEVDPVAITDISAHSYANVDLLALIAADQCDKAKALAVSRNDGQGLLAVTKLCVKPNSR
jgi:hypothetical protein